jgi:oligogalacturonide lyase
MHLRLPVSAALAACLGLLSLAPCASAQVGRRLPPEKKIVIDSVTGVPLTFLTSQPVGDTKIYQTHPQWTADGRWVIFHSNRARGQAFAVNEESGEIVQLTEKGFVGMLCVARQSMKLYLMRSAGGARAGNAALGEARGPFQIIEIDLEKLFADSAAGTLKPGPTAYERVCGTTPAGEISNGNMGLDANEDFAYFRISGDQLAEKLPPGTKIAKPFGPRGSGAGPNGLASMNLKTGEVKLIVAVPFQIGHVQTNPWMPGEIIFCWETGGKSPQRTWTVMADGTGLRPLYPEAPYEWVTHEAVITKDEVAVVLSAGRKIGSPDIGWGLAGTREKPSGIGIVNLRTREIRMLGQTATGGGFWHVNGSADGRWALGDDNAKNVYLIDRHTNETLLLTTGHKNGANDHLHPSFSADGTRIEINSAMLTDGKTMNICIVPLPKTWLARTYSDRAPP